ncbi:MAG: P22 phage major capsid protein family protein [Candidatus Dormibacteria bacterium]
MATNVELTIDMITQAGLIVLKNMLGVGNRCIREYDGDFGEEGAKIGDNLRIRVPPRFLSTVGPAPAQQNFTETYKEIAAQTQRNILLSWSSKELSLAMDDFADHVIAPVMAQLASDIDGDGLLAATQGITVTNSGYFTANYAGGYAGVGGLVTPGTSSVHSGPAPWTGATLGVSASANTYLQEKPFFDGKAALTNQAAPGNERYCVLSPSAASAVAPGLTTLFNPQTEISELYKQGVIGTLAGAEFIESQNIPTFTSGAWGANANVNVAMVNGDSTVTVGAFSSGNTVVAGDQFVVDGVLSVNPLSRMSTGQLQVFTVTAANTANAGNGGVFSVYPTINGPGQQFQTVNSLAAKGANVVFMGTSNTATAVNLMYQKNALALAVAPLEDSLPGAEVSSAVDPENGLSIRYVRQYVATTDQTVRRLDILYGWAVVRPELGVRIQA